MTTFTVSLITMDHINIESDVRLVETLGVDGLHIDIMDGGFVPRYGIYPEILSRVNDVSNLPLDLHLMVEDSFFTLDQFRSLSNLDTITFHVESLKGNEMRFIDKIRDIGAKPIAAINLATPLSVLDRMLANDEVDGVMFMGIHPGVLTQTARPQNIIRDLSELKKSINGTSAERHIGLDGAVNFDTMPRFLDAGITNFIGGSSSIFKDASFSLSASERARKVEKNWSTIKNLLGI